MRVVATTRMGLRALSPPLRSAACVAERRRLFHLSRTVDRGTGVPAAPHTVTGASMTGPWEGMATAMFGLGCFWGAERKFWQLPGVLVNAVCPGWVATDMGGSGGRPVSEGAAGVVWAATLPDNGPTGGFFRDGQPVPW